MRARYLLAAFALLMMACPGSTSVPRDGRQFSDGPVWPDLGQPYADGKVWPDQYKAPDLKWPPDIFPWKPDTYFGAPFGCKSDADCFGKLCCGTPWGVKLCNDRCDVF